MQCRLQADIYLTGDRGAGREVRARAGQLCPPVEFGMCPPRASRRPGVKVNKGAIWSASSNPFFHPPSHSPVTGIGHFIHWPRPPAVTHTIAATCRLFYILRLRVQTLDWALFSAVWHRYTLGQTRSGAADSLSSIFIFHKLQIPALHLAAGMHANTAMCRGKLVQWWIGFPNVWHTIKNPVVCSVSSQRETQDLQCDHGRRELYKGGL